MRSILFLDDFIATRQEGLVRRYYQPKWLPDFFYLPPSGCSYSSVVPAPEGGYRLHYAAEVKGNSWIDFATSEDGLHWEKRHSEGPSRIKDVGGEQLDFPIQEGVSFYFDPEDLNPARRYKMVIVALKPHPKLYLLYSRDSTHWTVNRKHPLLGQESDAQNSLLRNHCTGRYQVVIRRAPCERRIFCIESSDLKTWSKPQLLLHPDPLDPPMTQFYGMPHFRYGDLFLGFLCCYQTSAGEKAHWKSAGIVHTELVYSYNGLAWNRTHRDFMPLRNLGEYGGCSMYGTTFLERENDCLVYAFGSLQEHHFPDRNARRKSPNYGLLVGRLRKDGFVGLTGSAAMGRLSSDCLFPRSTELRLNVRAPFGGVRVQVTDPFCKPFPGYRFEDCEEIRGDHIALEPRWRRHHDLAGAIAASKKQKERKYHGWIRLEICLEQAELFSIRGEFGVAINSGAPGHDFL